MKLEIGQWLNADNHNRPKIVAIIPARGGSTRLPDKNMRMFAGRPLVAWTILQAVNSLTVDEVWVSSDSDRILECAEKLGAHTFKRPEIEHDDAPGYVPILQVAEKVMKPTDILIGLMATSPLRKPDDIDRAITKWYMSPRHDEKFLMSVVPIHEDFRLRMMNDDYITPLPPAEGNNCRYDGNVHVSTLEMYRREIEAQGDHVYFMPYFLDEWQGLDVNSVEQFRFAELMFYDRILSDSLNPYEVYRKGGLKT